MLFNPFPILIVMVIAAAVLAIRALIKDLIIRARLRKYRTTIVPGRCAGCGYDLRASPSGVRNAAGPPPRPARRPGSSFDAGFDLFRLFPIIAPPMTHTISIAPSIITPQHRG